MAVPTGSPTRVFNEEWSLNMGQNSGASANFVGQVADSDDIMICGQDLVSSDYILYLSRVTSNGKVLWTRQFSVEFYPLQFTAAYNNKTYVYGSMKINPAQYNMYLYSLDSNTGEIIEGWTVAEHHRANAFGNNILNPSNASELWICSQRNSSASYFDLHIFCWDLSKNVIAWQITYHDDNYDTPREFVFIKDKLYVLVFSYASESTNYESRLLIINPSTGSYSSPKHLRCGGNAFEINARSLSWFGDYLYILGENVTVLYTYKNSYFQRYNLDGTLVSENMLSTGYDGYYVTLYRLQMINEDKFVIAGQESFNYLGEPDTGKYRIMAASYGYNPTESKVILENVQYFGEPDLSTTLSDALITQNSTYLCGISYSIEKGFRCGFVAKFASAFYEPPIEVDIPPKHWYDPLLLIGNWPFLGGMLGIGLLIGILIGRKGKAKAGRK
jgi:hypothetical protein